MPTSVPGSSGTGLTLQRSRPAGGGFSLIELLIVIAIVAVGAALLTWALPDSEAARLEEEGARLSALLEMARAEARVSGTTVLWVPRGAAEAAEMVSTAAGPDTGADMADFRFVGLPAAMALPRRWLDARVSAEVIGRSTVLLGPEAILPAQRVRLRLADRQLELASDGLGGFEPVLPPADGAATP